MQRKFLPLAITSIAVFSLFNWNCTKLDTSDIGSDQLPAVDNVHTFADTLPLLTTQGIFNDTTSVVNTNSFVLGSINNDPQFGKTTASIYFQLKPSFYPFYFGNVNDTITGPGVGLDSIVLCLAYKSFWGDSTLPFQFDVREINDFTFRDSIYTKRNINYAPNTGTLLASASVDVRRLGDTVYYKNGRDYSINTIRIKLPMAWSSTLFNRDSIRTNAANNAFYLDSIFRTFYHGLAVVPTGGGSNGLLYVSLADTSTKLEIHYRKRNKGITDTTYQAFRLSTLSTPPTTTQASVSSVANNIVRNRSGASISSPAPDELYLQTTPGSYVNISVPALSSMPNRIIHRAELVVKQVSNALTPLDDIFSPPPLLYIDLKDTTAAQNWKPIYYDLNPNEPYSPDSKTGYGYLPTSIDFSSFGGIRKEGVDNFNRPMYYYNFNISRYVQQIVTRHIPNYTLRLYAPYELYYPQMATPDYPAYSTLYGNRLAAGRIKVGAGNNTNYKMYIRVIYSNL